MSSTRQETRQALAALLAANVPTAQAVYSYQTASFDGQSPVVVVTSGGTNRQPVTMRGAQVVYTLDVHTFVLYRDPAAGWTEEHAEAALDALEAEIGAVLDAHRRAPAWQRIAYSGASSARENLPIEGLQYLHEVISLEVLSI